jgi:AcrR family transcriptional regulator
MNIDSKPNLREKLKETTREAILAAAVALIINDPGEVRMEAIAEKAGVAIGTLYNYFENRQVLIDTIIDKRRSTADVHIRQSLEQTQGMHISARLENLFQTLLSFLERHKTVTHHSLQLKETNPAGNGKKSLMGMLNDYVLDMLNTALERGEIRPEYMDVYQFAISGFLIGIFTKVDEETEATRETDFVRKLAELFMLGAGQNTQKSAE